MALFKKIVLKKVFAHFSAIFIYLLILKKFDYFSLIYTQKNSIFFEGPLALFVYYVFFLIMKPGRFRYVLAFIPAIFFYILFEIYYRTWGSTFKIITIKQLPELFEVLEFSHSILFVSLSITFFTIFVIFFDYRNKYKLALTFLTVVTIAMIFKFLPGTYVDYLQAQSVDISSFSDIESVQKNGRLFMVLYWEAKRRQAIASLQEISGEEDIVLKGLLQSAKLKKNVHIIVMESLFDPSLMINVKFSIVPIHPEFLKLFRDIGTSRSPVFGGRSAQAEFEVLCGVPALSEFDDIEFNVFGGGKTNCLPKILSSAGYLTIATNAFRPNYFNTDVAYRGLGFEEIYFPQEESKGRVSYFKKGNVKVEGFIFDGDLLSENLKFIREKLANDKTKPILNYVMASYGHYPFRIDYKIRPKMINLLGYNGSDSEIIENIANQFYYRTEAIAKFVMELKEIDPQSLILFLGDHLPGLDSTISLNKSGSEVYNKHGYLNGLPNNFKYTFFIGVANLEPVYLKKINHYDLPEIVYSYIINCKKDLEDKPIKSYEDYRIKYHRIMAEAVK